MTKKYGLHTILASAAKRSINTCAGRNDMFPIHWFKENAQNILIVLLIVLFAIFVTTMFSQSIETYIGKFLGFAREGEDGIKKELLTFLGIGMGGVLLGIQATIANNRAKAMEDAANAQAEANRNTEKGQRQERLKNAIEHLGNQSDSMRLGGAYELFHLAEDTNYLRQTVLDILCAHIRRTTSEEEYQEKHRLGPSEEIQSMLSLLFMENNEVFNALRINLKGSWLYRVNLSDAELQGADLSGARLQGADLSDAELQEANLSGARLQGADLSGAELQEANLSEAELQGADLSRARLQRANLSDAELQGADLFGTQLQEANLSDARLQGADLFGTQLQEANLLDARLQGADLSGARLQGANLSDARLQGADLSDAQMQEANLSDAQLQGVTCQSLRSDTFKERIQEQVDTNSDLSGIVFAGGLMEENLHSLVEGLSPGVAKRLRKKLKSHIGQPVSHALPEDSNAVTEPPYTKEEADQWIADYEDPVNIVPEPF